MKIFKIIFLVIFTFTLNFTFIDAKVITIEKATQIASTWLKKTDSNRDIDNVKTILFKNKKLAYIFNLSPAGYIIVPVNDILPPIKAYSLNSKFQANSDFANFLKQELYNLLYSNKFSGVTFENNRGIWQNILNGSSFAAIVQKGPLLKTEWNQAPFYNEKYPAVCSGDEDNITITHFYAGCVIIATGQIMKYYKWPVTGRGAHVYDEATVGKRSAIFSDRHYNYDIMPDYLPPTFDNSTDNESIDELSLLLYDISVAVEAQFAEDATGAYLFTASDALYKYFKYKPCQYIFRKNYGTDSQWFEVFKNEIDKNRPALFGINTCYNANVGHAVVVDGYKIDGDLKFLHLNMGLGGEFDGWYAVNNILNFQDLFSQEAVIGIEPDKSTDYLMAYDNLKPGDSFAHVVKLENNPNKNNKSYEVVKFQPVKCGYLDHIAYFIPYPHLLYEINVYEGSDNMTEAFKSEPIYTVSGSSTTTGWQYVEPENNIKISAGKNYYVVISLENNLESFDYIIPDSFKYIITTDNDNQGTGNSYYGTSLDKLEKQDSEDVLIRMGLKDSYSCTISDNNSSDIETVDNNSQVSNIATLNLYKYDSKNILINPDNVTIVVSSDNSTLIQPEAVVPSNLIGKDVSLKLYLFLPDYNVWIPYEDVKTTLKDKVVFTNIAEPIDLKGLSGLKIDVWFGFIIDNNIYYNNYNIVVN